jgi:hypothetical protein
MKTNPKYHYHCNLKQGRNENFVLLTISHLKRLHGYGHQGLEDQWETKDGTSKFERYNLIDQILDLFLKVIDLSTTNLKVTKNLHGY